MAGESTVILYAEDFEDLEDMDDSDAGILLKAIIGYLRTGEDYGRLTGEVRVMYRFIRRHIDRDKAKYQATCKKRAESGKLGGRPKKANVFLENQMLSGKPNESKRKQKNPDNEYDPEYEHEYEYEPEHEYEPVAPQAGADAAAPNGAEREKRIHFLKSMIRLYESGALTDKEDYIRYREELERLTGG